MSSFHTAVPRKGDGEQHLNHPQAGAFVGTFVCPVTFGNQSYIA